MAARVDGVEIIQDPGKAFAAFPRTRALGCRLDLDPIFFQASHSRLSTEPSAVSAAKPGFSARRPACKLFFSRGARALDGVLDIPPAQVRTWCLSIIMGGLRMAWRIGVDSGGTFTDVCLFDETTGRVEVWKVPSTPDDPSRGIARGVEEGVGRVGAEPRDVGYFGHGTTVATNALIQHRGVPTGLITTDGLPRPARDRPAEAARPLRPAGRQAAAAGPARPAVRGAERVRHDGTVETPLDEEARPRGGARR